MNYRYFAQYNKREIATDAVAASFCLNPRGICDVDVIIRPVAEIFGHRYVVGIECYTHKMRIDSDDFKIYDDQVLDLITADTILSTPATRHTTYSTNLSACMFKFGSLIDDTLFVYEWPEPSTVFDDMRATYELDVKCLRDLITFNDNDYTYIVGKRTTVDEEGNKSTIDVELEFTHINKNWLNLERN